MTLCNVVLSTEPRGGKGGVATVIPMYLEALGALGKTEFIPTHNGRGLWGKFVPWVCSFFHCVAVISRERRSPIVFHLHPGSGFCIIRMLLLAFFLRCIARQHVLVYLHTPYLETYLASNTWRLTISVLIRYCDRVIVLTAYARDLLDRWGLSEKARVIPNPFRTAAKALRRKNNADGKVTILIMGRLIDGKGFIETVRAMKVLPDDYNLVVAGDGDLADQLRQEIILNGLESRVRMLGWIAGKEKDELLATAGVFCLPSQVDSFGMSFVEAQCYDIPIVAFRHPPVMEVIRSDGAVFVDDLDPNSLSLAIRRANELNSTIEDGSGARWVDSSFGVDNISVLLKNVVVEVVG